MQGVASVIHQASNFISTSNEVRIENEREMNENVETEEIDLFDVDDTHTQVRSIRKSSRAMCLTCGIIVTIFVLVICQIIVPIIQDVTQNESFWESTNKVIALFEKYNMTTTEQNCNQSEHT